MRFWRQRLSTDVTPSRAVVLLSAYAAARGLPEPAALCGSWFGSSAVVAPFVSVSASSFPTVVDVDAPEGCVGGGWFGYLSYDSADPSGRSSGVPGSAWGFADHVLRWDLAGGCWFESLADDPGPLLSTVEEALSSSASLTWTASVLERPSAASHSLAVKACVSSIEAGELFQANICTRFTGPFSGSAAALFSEGVRRLSPSRSCFVSGPWGSVVSLSPELFLSRRGRRVTSVPIKGTLPRRGPADDGNALLLRRSAKDVAENVMITDLVRNDLGRVCEVGSVVVPSLLTVSPAPGVWHLASTVEGVLPSGVSDSALLAATFPPGSVTGAPKIRALDEIALLEPLPRGVYTGAVGMLSPVAGLELNVAIRTFEISAGRIALGVGGGITADSDSAVEWQECLHKAAPLETLLATPPAV
ncbi:aminodeoxychorismate synthase component I [Amycolatopsis rhabdoformis]|uniref:Aminodeoxychorismate synthase component I n=1 Tax=Amycolatopsis rhabdoformis TaxID=1448059 RepID=A0ABZ1IL95_9PSEU|nr:aminodeoxychorismate synthase component I [Amycolatopsis rhabdoformis]WSE35266.1 aminodeoxychorismate synthase component I [Amycolatopsis rhabdoformis]